MDKEYKEMIRENFLKVIKKEEVENNNKIIGDERNKKMGEEYKKLLIKNFYEYFDQDDLLDNVDKLEDFLMKIWLEATRQADERNSIK